MRTRPNTRKGRVSEAVLVSKTGSVKTQYHSSAAAPPPPLPWDYVWPMQSAAAELREKGFGIRWVAAGEKFPKDKKSGPCRARSRRTTAPATTWR
jgi:hypothetical protein